MCKSLWTLFVHTLGHILLQWLLQINVFCKHWPVYHKPKNLIERRIKSSFHYGVKVLNGYSHRKWNWWKEFKFQLRQIMFTLQKYPWTSMSPRSFAYWQKSWQHVLLLGCHSWWSCEQKTDSSITDVHVIAGGISKIDKFPIEYR